MKALSSICAVWPSVQESGRVGNSISHDDPTLSDVQDAERLNASDGAKDTTYGPGEYRFFVIFGTNCIRKIVTVPLDDCSGSGQAVLPVCLPSNLKDLWTKYQRHPDR